MKEIGILMLCSKHMEYESELYDRLYFQSDFNSFHVKNTLGKERKYSIKWPNMPVISLPKFGVVLIMCMQRIHMG